MNHIARRFRVLPYLFLALFLAACSDNNITPVEEKSPVATIEGKVATDWIAMQVELISKTPGFSPPVAARALGYSGVAMYEALVPGTHKYASLKGKLNAMPEMPALGEGVAVSWELVASATMAKVSHSLFANTPDAMKLRIDSLAQVFVGRASALPQSTIDNSIAHGEAVATAILAWAATDGGHEAYKTNFPAGYTSPTGEGFWVPTGTQLIPLQPYWGKVRPMILPTNNPNQFTEVVAPPAFSTDASSSFYAEAKEVYDAVKGNTPAQRDIALYWADGGGTCTPPGHSMAILCQCMDAMQGDLEHCAVAFAKLGIAMNDAFIACWETKFKYNLMRPQTYIQQHIDNSFAPSMQPVATPPFPEYTSGHSVQSGAMAEVLGDVMGRNMSFTDRTHEKAGLPARTYANFDEAAQEAAISRLYGGIHYRAAIDVGMKQGKRIGEAVNAIRFEK